MKLPATLFLQFFIAFGFLAVGQPSPLFDSDEILELTLRGEMRTVFKERGEESAYHMASLNYETEEGTMNIPVKIKTRGHFRKLAANCKYPPILLNFAKASTPENSAFKGQDKLKLVTPCQGDDYVVREYLVYKLYNLISPKSFKARLVKVVYDDTVKNKTTDAYYGMLLEDEKQMAARNNCERIKVKRLPPESVIREDFLKMAVFQYMIGNTDWSVQYLQNIKLITTDSKSLPTAVPYDFDHAGIVGASYANPAPELRMSSTKQRRYRGYCMPEMTEFKAVFATFNELKDAIYEVYSGNELLDEKYKKDTIKFLDKFFETINDPEAVEKEFSYPCDKRGTGNVVIKGLKKDN